MNTFGDIRNNFQIAMNRAINEALSAKTTKARQSGVTIIENLKDFIGE
jgi:hypothetical protein